MSEVPSQNHAAANRRAIRKVATERKAHPRIVLTGGRYYAMPGRGHRKAVGWGLFFAILWCDEMNAKRGLPPRRKVPQRLGRR